MGIGSYAMSQMEAQQQLQAQQQRQAAMAAENKKRAEADAKALAAGRGTGAPTGPTGNIQTQTAMAPVARTGDYAQQVKSIVGAVGGETGPVIDPGERPDYAGMTYEQLSQQEGSLASTFESGKSVTIGGKDFLSDPTQMSIQKLLNVPTTDDERGQAVQNAQQTVKEFLDVRKSIAWKYGDARQPGRKMFDADTKRIAEQRYKAAMDKEGFSGATIRDDYSQMAQAAVAGETRTQLGQQHQVQTDKYSKYQAGIEQQRQETLDSPEYQQMQEAIATQKELVAKQTEQMEQVQSQYDQLQQDYQARDEELTQYLEGMGETERKALAKRRQQLKAGQKEDLMRRGLTSSSALSAALRGVDLGADESLGAMEERLRTQKMNYRSQFSGETLQAQRGAAEYASRAAEVNFAAGQAVPGTMTELAQMMSQQRIAREQTRAGLGAAALGAEASRFGASMSSAASRYASLMGYKSDMASTAQRESASQRTASTQRYQTQMGQQLGYAQIAGQKEQSKIAAGAQYRSRTLGTGENRVSFSNPQGGWM